jgi:hypothetical protein
MMKDDKLLCSSRNEMVVSGHAVDSDMSNNFELEYSFIDVTEWFRNACAKLPVGHVIKCDRFAMFDAMLAIEVMNDRMDSGLLTAKDTLGTPLTLEWVQKSIQDVTMENAAVIGALLFRCLLSFFNGAPLSTTLMTSVYFQFAENLPYTVSDLPVPSKLILSVIYLVKKVMITSSKIVHESNVMEEEDFCLEGHLFPQSWNDGSFSNIEFDFNHVLLSLTNLRDKNESFLSSLVSMLYHLDSSLDSLVFSDPSQVNVNLSAALHFLDLLEVSSYQEDHCPLKLWELGFNPRAQRKLSTNCPPREFPLLTFEKSVETLNLFLLDLKSISTFEHGSSFLQLVNFYDHLSFFRKATCIPRCIAQATIFDPRLFNNQELFKKWLSVKADLPGPYLNPQWVQKVLRSSRESEQFKRYDNRKLSTMERSYNRNVSAFLEFAHTSIGGLLQNFLHNTSRTRRLSCKLLRRMNQESARIEAIDSELETLFNIVRMHLFIMLKGVPDKKALHQEHNPRYFSCWVKYQRIRLAVLILEWGFYLELYSENEMAVLHRCVFLRASCFIIVSALQLAIV